jgi:hypothetical protein
VERWEVNTGGDEFQRCHHEDGADALIESSGRHDLAQMITNRESLGRELQGISDEKTNPWRIAIKEKGSMVIVPSSAVETMGLGGLLGTASLSSHKQ